MSDMQIDGWRILQIGAWIITAVAAVILAPLKWIVQRAVAQLESHTEKIDALEKTTVTRLELEAALRQLRADRLVMHQENVSHLIRIENKIEEIDKRETYARDDMRKIVNALNVQVAVLVDRAQERKENTR